ncbi:hypothetical protein LCGC14_2428020 [marine sediment metagenome]|uniref:HK97 gp10 family phage protein n=1 Tax=marine sediment metagenome TaxID=412755 RepID=A0A0F9CA21_9ZZZZ
MIDVDIRIGGFRELDEAFKTLPNAVSKRILRTAIRKALQPVKSAAVSIVHVMTGKLKKSIIISTKVVRSQAADSELRRGDAALVMGTSKEAGAYAHFEEFGTSKHSPHAFMRPAWDSNKAKVLQKIGDEAWKSLQKMAARLYKQAKAGKLSKIGKRSLFG